MTNGLVFPRELLAASCEEYIILLLLLVHNSLNDTLLCHEGAVLANMSEELTDEIEAINSIYGDGTLEKAGDGLPDIYILSLPGDAVSLRLQFSSEYPSEPPVVLGTHSSGEHGKRGDASRDLTLFRQAVGEVYEPGQVCLFDAVEKLKEYLESRPTGEETEPGSDSSVTEKAAENPDSWLVDLPEPPWVLSDPFIELRSTFVASLRRSFFAITSKPVCSALAGGRQEGTRGDTQHHCLADTWPKRDLLSRLQRRRRDRRRWAPPPSHAAHGPLGHHGDCDQVVWRPQARPRRFALINAAARDAFVKAGLVDDSSGKKKGHGK